MTFINEYARMGTSLNKRDFIMEIYIYKDESYVRAKKILSLSVIILMFIGLLGIALLEPVGAKAEDNTKTDPVVSVVSTQGNTLIGVSNPFEPMNIKTVKVVVTAYSSTVWQTDDTPFITASGETVRDGIIANNMLPFGTLVRIPEVYGDKVFVVEDRMNTRKGNYHFDVWLPEYEQAKDFGAKRTYVEVIQD